MTNFKTLSSETIFRGRAFSVRRDHVELPNGKTTKLDIVDHSGAVTLLPLDGEGKVWFVRQYRHAAGQVVLELPAGVLNEGEAPETTAHREIREEIGMAAANIEKLGEFMLAPGYSTERMHVYLATGLSKSPLPQDEDEFLEIEQIPVAEVYSMAEAGQIMDAKTLGALLLARPRLAKYL